MSYKQIKTIKRVLIVLIISIAILFLYEYVKNENMIVIGTKNITEQRIVACMLKEVIERDTDYNVKIISGMDATSFIHNAILHDDIDMYVEYSSTSFLEIFGQKYEGQSRDFILDYIKKMYPEVYDLQWISSLGFDNSNVLICKSFCEENNINTYSDLFEFDFSFAAPAYFYERSDGFNLLEDTYGDATVDKRKMDPILIYTAVLNDYVDAGLAFSTDAKLLNGDYKFLQDDKNSFPIYDAGIVINNKTLLEYPELEIILHKFNNLLNNDIIRWANNKVENENESIEDVASELVLKLNV